MTKNSWVRPGNVTPASALSLAKEASYSKEVQQKGVTIQASSLSDASLLYLAATHLDLTIESIALEGEKTELSPLMLHTQFERWHEYIVQQPEEEKSAQQQAPKKRANRKNPSHAIAALDELIGLQSVKQQVEDVIAFSKVSVLRKRKGLPVVEMGQHLVFTGNPGTGKTTVARIVGDIYRDLGLLTSGHFVETDGRGLIAEYVGQTAERVKTIVGEAMDGVLFIDEAYALIQGEDGSQDYGPEAIATLIKMMEDNRDRLVVILAGYEDEMEQMLASNPGLKSRFKTKIDFPDYGPVELMAIFEQLCAKQAYLLTKDAAEKATALFAAMHEEREQHFGNGRAVRNAFDRAVMNQASRIMRTRRPNKKALQTITDADIPAPSQLSW